VRSLASIRASSPVPLAERYTGRGSGGGWLMPRSGGYVTQMETMRSVGTVYAIVNRLSTSVSKTCWKLWDKPASGLKEDRTEITSNAALDLWNRPNPFMSQRQLVEAFQQHKELTGEGNLVVGKAGKIPLELWPIRPDRIEPVPDPFKYLLGWVYTGPNGDRVPLELDELVRSVSPDPLDPYRGLSAIRSILVDLDANRLSQQYQRNFYTNSARPNGVLEIDRRLDDDQFNEMRDRWAEQHRGVSKAHRVAIIEQGAKWVETQLSQRDMQFAELSTVARDKVLETWGFPKFALGMVDDVNRATAEASDYFYGKWLVEDRLDALKDMLNTQLLSLFGKDWPRRFEFDYESPVPENAEAELSAITAKSNAAVAMVEANFDAPETLEWLGLPEIEHSTPEPPPAIEPPPVVPAIEPAPAVPASAALRTTYVIDADPAGIDLAMRWVVEAHIDDNVCDPCRDNDGKTYRNRAAAYEDYPNGKGYVKCVGAEFGNSCRCSVVKRRKKT
jgi:HK97 family phage portal protein